MAKSTILKELVNNEIDLEIAISRLMVIASDINNESIYKWAENELKGYKNNDDLPPYRKLGFGYITYSGINGRMKMTNQPMPLTVFSPEERELIDETPICQSVKALQKLAQQKEGQDLSVDLTYLAEVVFERLNIRCTSIKMRYSYTDFIDLLSNIRTKLISMFIKLDKEFGCLDNLDIDISKIDSEILSDINTNLHEIVYMDNRAEVL